MTSPACAHCAFGPGDPNYAEEVRDDRQLELWWCMSCGKWWCPACSGTSETIACDECAEAERPEPRIFVQRRGRRRRIMDVRLNSRSEVVAEVGPSGRRIRLRCTPLPLSERERGWTE